MAKTSRSSATNRVDGLLAGEFGRVQGGHADPLVGVGKLGWCAAAGDAYGAGVGWRLTAAAHRI
jgi:hypothetical protein